MKSALRFSWTQKMSASSLGSTLGAFGLVSALLLPIQSNAATINFGLTWTNTTSPSDTFSGTLKVDTALFPASGGVNLASTSATFSVTIPQLGKITYSMADLARFDVALSQSDVANLSVGQDLMTTGVVGKAIIFGKVGSAARKNFNQCANQFGVCFNREAQPPVYNLTSMKVLSVGR